MTEHEQLKEICDVIGYESKEFLYFEADKDFDDIVSHFYREIFDEVEVDVREIIFTQEFMDKFNWYICIKDPEWKYWESLYSNLNNPIQHLYNTLWLWVK